MNKFSTACFALLVSFAPLATSNLSAAATPIPSSNSKSILLAGSNNSYRTNWERSIRNGVINRPSKVTNAETAMRMFWSAVSNNDDYNATRRLGQYMVIYSEKYGVDAALQEEARIDNMLRQRTGNKIRGRYPLFNSIFPDDSDIYSADAQ
jgi:hypothetical protein